MRSFTTSRLWILLLSVLAVGALLELAIGMDGISFREGQRFGGNETISQRADPTELIRSVLAVPLQTQITFWLLLAGLVILIGVLLSPEGRKRLFRMVLRAILTYWLLYYLFTRYPTVLGQLGFALMPSAGAPALEAESVPPPAFAPPPSNSWLTYAVTLLLLLVAGFVGWRAYQIWQQLRRSQAEPAARKLARIARSSLQDLAGGRDSTDVILNCYFRMSDVVAEKRHLQRSLAMTPHEFAARLQQAGLPGEAVRQLTQLFEAVRYGGQRSSSGMVKEAVACLTTILTYCGETV